MTRRCTNLATRARRASRLLLAVVWLCAGCALEQEISRTPRTAVEQLLLTTAVDRALTNLTLHLPPHSTIHLEVSGYFLDRAPVNLRRQGTGVNTTGVLRDPTVDFLLVRDAVAVALGQNGYRIRSADDQPQHLVKIAIESLGTMQGFTFVGMPPIQSVLIPFSLPELTLYKAQAQSGYARLHLDVFDFATGEYRSSSATIIGRSRYDQYTAFFYITWIETDLTAPP